MPKDGTRIVTASTRLKSMVVTFGRGNTGKTTGALEMAWRAAAAGRDLVIVDADTHSQALFKQLDGVIVPRSGEPAHVREAITRGFDAALERNCSILFDFGTQDRPMLEYSRDIDFLAFCEDEGFTPLVTSYVGPDPEDLVHVHAIWRAGFFRPPNWLVYLNEGRLTDGQVLEDAFAPILASPLMAELGSNVKTVLLHRLPFLEALKEARKNLYVEIENATSKVLGPMHRRVARDWVKKLDARRAEFLACLP